MESRISQAVEKKNCGYNCVADAAEFLEEELNK